MAWSAEKVQAAGTVLAVVLSIPAIVLSIWSFNRTIGDSLELSEPELGLLISRQWRLYNTQEDDEVRVTSADWAASDPGARYIQIRLHNDGVNDVHLKSIGLVLSASGQFLFFGPKSKHVEDDAALLHLHCGPAARREFGQCSDKLEAKDAVYARIDLTPELLAEISPDRRSKPLEFWLNIGSGDTYCDTGITLPAEAFPPAS